MPLIKIYTKDFVDVDYINYNSTIIGNDRIIDIN